MEKNFIFAYFVNVPGGHLKTISEPDEVGARGRSSIFDPLWQLLLPALGRKDKPYHNHTAVEALVCDQLLYGVKRAEINLVLISAALSCTVRLPSEAGTAFTGHTVTQQS